MESIDLFTENFFSFANMLGSKVDGGCLSAPSGSVAASSGLSYAGENYLLLQPGSTLFEAERLIDFFNARKLLFVAPELPGTPRKLIAALEAKGILPVRNYTAMSMGVCTKGFCEPSLARVQGEAAEWGRAVWEGFDGGPEVPAEYLALARHFAGHRENTLYLLKEENRAVSSAMLHQTANSCGLYYFATPPAFRRQGFARRLMKGLAGEAAQKYIELVLLATPEGLPFYLDFGFKPLAEITMRSNSPDL